MSEIQTLLKVDNSLKEARWVFPAAEQDLVTRIAQNYGLPEFVARLLHCRGVDPDGVQSFLHPTLKEHFPDPFAMAGMRDFANDIAARISGGNARIGMLADFDVDGATSAGILIRFFRHLGLEVPVYIPDRLSEGYGPSAEALKSLQDQGADFVIMADCGITAFEAVEAGNELGLELTIFDHHEAEDSLPPAKHIVNPKRSDCDAGLEMLAACGVSFMACVAMNNALRETGFYKEAGINEAPLKSWMDLVALGTVCDMVPLTGVNRLFVRIGFEQMAMLNNAGIKVLCEVANIECPPEPSHAGWVLGPRINAGSRVHRSDLGAKLLATDDLDEARSIAWTLEECNDQRKTIQSSMMEQAVAKIEAEGLNAYPIIVVGDPDWHPGLSGLVAGRLKERYNKPAVVVTYAENPQGVLEGRGSGRSVKGVNMAEAFIDARNKGLLVKGGGHAMAGGFTVMPDQMPAFRDYLYENIQKQMEHIETVQEVLIDGIATVRGAQINFVKLLTENVGPFGVGNPEPVFALANVRLHRIDVLKDKHIRALVSDWEGGRRMKAMLFNGIGTKLGDTLVKQGAGAPFHLAGQFQINRWQGNESVEFHISDGAPGIVAAGENY